jgi:hypothetical protein
MCPPAEALERDTGLMLGCQDNGCGDLWISGGGGVIWSLAVHHQRWLQHHSHFMAFHLFFESVAHPLG